MTPERLEEIRAAITEKPVGELEHVLPELLAEIDRLRAAADGLAAFLTEKAAKAGADGDAESDIDAKTGYLMRGIAYVDAKQQGRELGLFKDKP